MLLQQAMNGGTRQRLHSHQTVGFEKAPDLPDRALRILALGAQDRLLHRQTELGLAPIRAYLGD